MTFDLSVPRSTGTTLDLAVETGNILLLLGANGTGKSSLMHRFYNAHHANARRITAHRQTWFESNAITFSPQSRQQAERNILGHDTSPQARWKEYDPSSRPSIAVYDLVDAENVQAREIASAAYSDDLGLVRSWQRRTRRSKS